MQWNSLEEFLHMGGYAFYVWSSFGVTALVVLAEIWQVRAKRRAVLQSLRDEFADTQALEGEQA
jgi:heme exporter protein D